METNLTRLPIDFMNDNLDYNSFMQMMNSYYNQPMSTTATAGYGLAQQNQANQLALGQGQNANQAMLYNQNFQLGQSQQANDLSMFDTSQNNQMSQFNKNLAMQQSQQLWEQQMGGRMLSDQEAQQQWQNANNPATQAMIQQMNDQMNINRANGWDQAHSVNGITLPSAGMNPYRLTLMVGGSPASKGMSYNSNAVP